MSVCNAVIKFCLGLNGTENVSKFLLQKISQANLETSQKVERPCIFNIKQLLDSVFVISGIIKVEVSVIISCRQEK